MRFTLVFDHRNSFEIFVIQLAPWSQLQEVAISLGQTSSCKFLLTFKLLVIQR